uniref:Uncharacterized protein n=1 Tax=Oryza meridionalis TaxID=40149 RepID=A0A0E0CCX9_9ORYZ
MSTSEEAGLPDPTTAASSLVDCRLPGREGCKPLHPSSPLSSHLHVSLSLSLTLSSMPDAVPSPIPSTFQADPVVALFGSTTLLSTVFLARSPRRSPSLGARSSSGAAGFGTRRTHADWFLGGWGEQEQQLGDQSHDGGKAWAMAKYGDDGSKAQTMARYGVQMGNEQCCQQEIEDTKHGLESGSVQMGNEQRCQQEIEDTKHGLESGSITYDPAKLKFSDDIKDSRNENVPAAMAFHFLHTPVSYLHAVTPSDVDNLLRCNRWLSTSIVADDVRP